MVSSKPKRVGPAADVDTSGDTRKVQDLKDGYPKVDWPRVEALQVFTVGGEPIRLMDLWKDGRVVFMFLRRFECQTCLSYIIMFAHLQPILSRSNVRLIFLTCHNDLSEVNTFLVTFAFWLQKLKDQTDKRTGPGAVDSPALAAKDKTQWTGALPGELYVDMDRSVYRFFGIAPIQRQITDSFFFFGLFHYWAMFGLYGKKHNVNKKNRLNTYIYTRRILYRFLLSWIKIPKKKEVWRQTPGIIVVEKDHVVYRNLKLVSRLGKGKESEVFSSSWMGVKVAVKFFRIEGTTQKDERGADQIDQGIKSFANEAAILMSLKHPNVIPFLGFGSRPPHQFLIMELMPRGSLFQLLGDTSKKGFLLDTAKGMAFLHSCTPLVVHQDLKSLNLLVAEDWTLKVSDFGIAHAKKTRQRNTGGNETGITADDEDDGIAGGTPQWMSPEHMMFEGSPTTKMDVFAFAVIMWEVASRERPWRNVTASQVEDNKLINTCWAQNPKHRPDFRYILKALTNSVVPA
ncbi:kinase-like domain-containing protein [Chytridium lagenaria]|nr:kinase-like domain-containing protein [Chytridium lagenaria]